MTDTKLILTALKEFIPLGIFILISIVILFALLKAGDGSITFGGKKITFDNKPITFKK